MTQKQNFEIDALLILQRIGQQSRQELYATVPGLNHNHISRMENYGYIKQDRDIKDIFQITNSGKRKIGVDTSKTVSTSRQVLTDEDANYDGAELRPYAGRPGCEAALSLPSRLPDGLHYPDGRFIPNHLEATERNDSPAARNRKNEEFQS